MPYCYYTENSKVLCKDSLVISHIFVDTLFNLLSFNILPCSRLATGVIFYISKINHYDRKSGTYGGMLNENKLNNVSTKMYDIA